MATEDFAGRMFVVTARRCDIVENARPNSNQVLIQLPARYQRVFKVEAIIADANLNISQLGEKGQPLPNKMLSILAPKQRSDVEKRLFPLGIQDADDVMTTWSTSDEETLGEIADECDQLMIKDIVQKQDGQEKGGEETNSWFWNLFKGKKEGKDQSGQGSGGD